MADSTMMLAHNYAVRKFCRGGMFVSGKLDCIPGVYTIEEGQCSVLSRQGKPITSTPHICNHLHNSALPIGTRVIGEHGLASDPVAPFSVAGGAVRAKDPNDDIILNVFDIVLPDTLDAPFRERWRYVLENSNVFSTGPVKTIPHYFCSSVEQLGTAKHCIDHAWNNLFPLGAKTRKIEGYMLRDPFGTYTLTRSWAVMRDLNDATVDLRIVGFTQAKDKHGNLKPMIGNFLCEDAEGKRFNVGPGCSEHSERTALFQNFGWDGCIAVVKYKPDPTYKGLRQPTFQRLHTDKTEPDIV